MQILRGSAKNMVILDQRTSHIDSTTAITMKLSLLVHKDFKTNTDLTLKKSFKLSKTNQLSYCLIQSTLRTREESKVCKRYFAKRWDSVLNWWRLWLLSTLKSYLKPKVKCAITFHFWILTKSIAKTPWTIWASAQN